MTADRRQWRHVWIVYAFIGLLVMAGAYVGGYLSMGEYTADHLNVTPLGGGMICHFREFHNDTLLKVFSPLAWAESKIRGDVVVINSPRDAGIYEPDW